jgi:hypothetical protein
MNIAELPYGAPDPMMEEIREIRTRIQETMKSLSQEERQAWLHEQAVKGLLEHGYRLVPHPDRPNAYKVQEIAASGP